MCKRQSGHGPSDAASGAVTATARLQRFAQVPPPAPTLPDDPPDPNRSRDKHMRRAVARRGPRVMIAAAASSPLAAGVLDAGEDAACRPTQPGDQRPDADGHVWSPRPVGTVCGRSRTQFCAMSSMRCARQRTSVGLSWAFRVLDHAIRTSGSGPASHFCGSCRRHSSSCVAPAPPRCDGVPPACQELLHRCGMPR